MINWKFGENELNINLKKDLSSASTLLTKVFSKDFSKKGAIAWLKEQQCLYAPNDPAIVMKLAALNYEDLVAKELRALCIKREGPWAYQLDTIRIGIPNGKDQPKAGFANVCENGKYFTKKIRILSLMDQTKLIEVEASGRYECPKGLKFPDVQLNSSDAEKLFGTLIFSKYQKGMALILTEQ